jgi:L-threonylcarbamoyladenylate synthase
MAKRHPAPMTDFENDLRSALKVLRDGGVILYPTDTIWGLGCDPSNKAAIDKIYRIKIRAENKSLIILVNGIDMLERYVSEIPASAREIISVSDAPLTIIFPEGKNLAPGVCSDDGSVGIRICGDDFCSELIERFRKPLISTSANISGKSSPAHFGEIEEELISQVDYTINYRQNDRQKHSASPVIKIDKKGVLKIIRM